MQKAESLSFQTVWGLEGRRQSLMNKISIGAQSLRSWFLQSFNAICKLDTLFEITNHRVIPTSFSTERKTISRRDELWFVGFFCVMSCDLLGHYQKFHAFTKCIVHRCLHNVGTLRRYRSKRRFRSHEYSENRKLISPIKRYGWTISYKLKSHTSPVCIQNRLITL